MATAGVVPQTGYTTKRTEAMPKTTLFGSSLEIQDAGARSFDPTQVKLPRTPAVKGKGLQFVLPEDVKRGLPEAEILERSKQVFGVQKSKANDAINELKLKEQDILYSRNHQTGSHTARTGAPDTSRSQWFTEKDLDGSKEINVIGLNKNQSFNRDKYGPRAPVHNYSLNGDLLRPGMDFPRRERTEIQLRNLGYGTGDMKGPLAYSPTPRAHGVTASAGSNTPRRAAVELPPNIKHQYGSRVCDRLLSDKSVVESTIKKQNELKLSSQRPSRPFKVPAFNKEMNPQYEMLGNSLRMNVAPGYSIDQSVSTTKTAFNDQVHLFRDKDPDKWRYQKDELSTWSEHQFLYQKLSGQWKAMLDNLPKYKPNWAHEVKPKSAPANTQNQRKQIKPKPKPKPPKTAPNKKDKEKSPDQDLPEVVFLTPPVTPPPEKVQIKQQQQEDKEFWNFYDKG